MAQSDSDRSAVYYDALAPRYDAEVTTKPNDVLARHAFFDLVARHVEPGRTLLDFGCGTGLDADRYARRGYRVVAYDNSAAMMAELKRRCSTEVASGRVIPWSGNYSAFPDAFAHGPAAHAVVANFAVLNMIRDLAPLFTIFARHLAPPGWLIVSVVNPLRWQDLLTRRWWRGAMQYRRGEPRFHLTQHFVSYLHSVPALLRAAPQFRLVGRANAGAFVRYDASEPGDPRRLWWGPAGSSPQRLKRAAWRTPASRFLGTFVFLVMRRDP